MPDALSPSQIELLRGLPSYRDEPRPFTEEERRIITANSWPMDTRVDLLVRDRTGYWKRSHIADLLLATIDTAVAAERERVLKAIVGDLENAATDCDGHTPYSILMALAEEIRAEHAANPNPQSGSDGGMSESVEAFLAARLIRVDRRAIGISSNAMIAAAYGWPVGAGQWPHDRWDMERCERTYESAPADLQRGMLPTLERFRERFPNSPASTPKEAGE